MDPAIEFVALEIEPTDAITTPVARHSYAVSETRPTDTFMRVLGNYRFAVPYAHRTRCAAAIAIRLQDDLAHWGEHPVRGIELLDTVFYRERRAYLVGRVLGEHRFSPCVIALVRDEHGIRAEAVLTRRADVAQLFGVSRSYFQADLPTVGDGRQSGTSESPSILNASPEAAAFACPAEPCAAPAIAGACAGSGP